MISEKDENWQNTTLFESRLESKVEKSANYFKNGFNCSQAVLATFAEDFMNRFIEKNGTVVCRELLGYDVSKEDDMKKIKEMGLFQITCPKMIQCATEIVEEMLQE